MLLLYRVEAHDTLAPWLQLENIRRARVRSHPLASSDAMVPALAGVRAPIDAIWGELDPHGRPALQSRFDLLPRFDPELVGVVIEGAGHWVMYERAAEFNEALRRLLSDPRSPREFAGPAQSTPT